MTKQFFMLHGRNGSTYVFNAGSLDDIRESMKFYKALTLKGKVMKSLLFVVLFLLGKLRAGPLQTGEDISNYLATLCDEAIPFDIDAHCSVHVAPTRNKIILHRHGRCFEKIAFGGSYTCVKNEATIYQKFTNSPRTFWISQFSGFEDHADYCRFCLSNDHLLEEEESRTVDWATVLAEFFTSHGATTGISVKSYLLLLREESLRYGLEYDPAHEAVLASYLSEYGEETVPLGLVHRDFKPWNTLSCSKPLIFDFEEAIGDGLPGEDLLNFYIDPIINYQSSESVQSLLSGETVQQPLRQYAKRLGLGMPVSFFIYCYLVNRILFWQERDKDQTAGCYERLLNDCLQTSSFG